MNIIQRTMLISAALLCSNVATAQSDPVNQTRSVRGGADFTTVTYAPDPANYDSPITYTINMVSGGPGGVTVDGSFSNLDLKSFADLNPFSQNVTNFYDDGQGGGFVASGMWACNASTGTFSCSPDQINGQGVGSLPPGNHRFDITVIVDNAAPPSFNTFNLDLTTTFGSPLSVPTSIEPAAGVGTTLQMTQGVAQNPQFPVAGDPLQYLIEVSNTGSSTADPFFSLDIGSVDAVSFAYISGPFQCAAITGGINCSYDNQVGGPFQMGETRTLVLSALSPPPGVQLGTFITNVNLFPGGMDTVAGSNPLAIATNNDATINTSIIPPNDPTVMGSQLVYTITVDNLGGGAAARDVVVDFFGDDDVFSNTSSFDSMGGTNWSCSGPLRSTRSSRGSGINQFCTYTLDLAPGASTTPLTVVVDSGGDPQATQYIADIFQAAFNYGGSSGDLQSVPTTLIQPGGGDSDMSLAFTDPSLTVFAGEFINVPIDIGNLGPDDASIVVVDLAHGPGMFLASSDGGPDWTCLDISPGVEQCTYSPPSFSSGNTSQLVVNYQVGGPGQETLSALVGSDNMDPNSGNDSDSLIVDITQPPSFFITVQDSPDPVQATQEVTYDVSVESSFGGGNRNQRGALTNVEVVATLPAGWMFSGFTSPSGNWTCTTAGQIVTCSNPNIPFFTSDSVYEFSATTANANGTFTTNFNATADGEQPFMTSVDTTVTGATGPTGVDLQLIRESSVESVQIGDEFEYQYTVNNLGSAPATGLQVTETLPEGISFLGMTGLEWACQVNGQNILCNYLVNPLLPGDSTSFAIQLQAPDFEGDVSSTAVLTQNEVDINPGNNTDSTTVTVVQRPPVNLVLDKTSSVEAVPTGGAFQYQLSVLNASDNPAAVVRIEDMLPAGVGYVGFTSSDFICSEDNGLVICTLSSPLLAGENRIVTLDVIAPSENGVITNTATVSSAEVDTLAADNTSSVDTLVGGAGADLSIGILASASSASVNQDLNYTLTVLNLGPDDASDVQVVGSLAPGYGLESIDAADWTCSDTGGTVSCDRMSPLAAGQTSVIVLNGLVTTDSGTLMTSAMVSASTSDPDSSNNTASASTTVAAGGDLANLEVIKVDSKDPVMPGESFDYIITVRNLGLGTARQVQIVDQLPSALTVTDIASPSDVSCLVASSMLTCDFDNRLPNGVDKVITVTVTAPDEEQVLSNTVSVLSLSQDSDLSNNLDIEETTVSRTPSEDQLLDALDQTLGGLNDPLIGANIAPLASLCSSPPPSMVEFCAALFGALNDGRGGEAADAIRSIVGLQTKSQNTSLVEASAVQFRNIDARMAQNRGGAVGFSVAGLNIRYGDENLPVSFMQTADDEDTEISSAGLVKPWGFFANGTISMGEQDNETNQVGYDFDTYGVTAGVDYRFSTQFIMGAALGYADYESDFIDGSSLETDGLTLHLYSSYYPTDRLYIDGRLSVGSQDFSQLRPISFTLGDFSVNDLAIGNTEADQLAFALSSGYNFNRNGWNITPSISLSYLDAEIDGFTETGTDFALVYDKQDVESLIFGASLNVSKAISLSKGILTPTFDVSYHHESSNDDNNINSQILGSSASSSFFVDADSPDRNYGSAGVGVVYITSNGKQLYLNYREVLGISGFSRSTFNAGFRMEF